MSEGEHTIISKIPRERLNQIAGRKLSALGLAVRLGGDRETLEGELPFSGPLAHPAGGEPIGRARFAVVGHDTLRFLDPPLASLPPVPFADVERAIGLEQRVAAALQRRVALLREQGARLRALGLEVTTDLERLAARAVVKTPTHAFEIVGGADGVRVSRVAPVGGRPFEIPATFPPLRPEEHATRADMDVWLASRVPEMEEAARAAARPVLTPVPEGERRLVATPPPRSALTLGRIARAFGDSGVLAPGAPVEVLQEFQFAGTHYRFVAVREVGTRFRARLIGPSGDVWSERIDLSSFVGIAPAVAAVLGVAADGPAAPAAAPTPTATPVLPGPGEVWAMNVMVESAAGDEVRYVGTDADGRPYGAARVLKRGDFEAVFTSHGGGWRLLVVVDQVQGDSVLYRQLDSLRQPMGAPRKMATAVLAANFVPEEPAGR